MVEHVAITDPNIHPTKGVASAANNSILTAFGGVDTWRPAYEVPTVRNVIAMEGGSTSDQVPSANDVEMDVSFGSSQDEEHVALDSSGTITIKTDGFYEFKFNFTFGRSGNSGTSNIFVRFLIDDNQVGFTEAIKLEGDGGVISSQFDLQRPMSAGNTCKVQLIRDSTSSADGGLVAITSPTGWVDVPSACVRVNRVEGAI